MIPKKIHYCWFGGKELPKNALKAGKSTVLDGKSSVGMRVTLILTGIPLLPIV